MKTGVWCWEQKGEDRKQRDDEFRAGALLFCEYIRRAGLWGVYTAVGDRETAADLGVCQSVREYRPDLADRW